MEDLQTQKILRDPDSTSYLSSSKAISMKDLILQFGLLLTTFRNKQRTSRRKRMNAKEFTIPVSSTKEFTNWNCKFLIKTRFLRLPFLLCHYSAKIK